MAGRARDETLMMWKRIATEYAKPKKPTCGGGAVDPNNIA